MSVPMPVITSSITTVRWSARSTKSTENVPAFIQGQRLASTAPPAESIHRKRISVSRNEQAGTMTPTMPSRRSENIFRRVEIAATAPWKAAPPRSTNGIKVMRALMVPRSSLEIRDLLGLDRVLVPEDRDHEAQADGGLGRRERDDEEEE